MEIKLLYQDRHFLIAEKPAQMLSEPQKGKTDVLTEVSTKIGYRVFPVHRLDCNTGGAMVLAKDGRGAAELSALWQQREVTKQYIAVIHGVPCEPIGRFNDFLFKDSAKNKSFVVDRERRGVKKASLTYELLQTVSAESGEQISLVRVVLETGRTHQVRVQFSHRGMPLLGDGKYGSRDNHCETALWSERISFINPFSHKPVEAISHPPKEYPWILF